jgi:uncharacterized damage-inducible protein DinB
MINKPQTDEYASWSARYVNLVETTDVIALLEQLKQKTYNFFSGMTDESAMYTYSEGKWTFKEMLGHMIDAERTFGYRAFVFSRDNVELPGFDQNVYVANTDYNSQKIKDLAEEYKATRESNLYLFRAFTEEQLMRKGIANNNLVSVRALVYITAGHELHHWKVIEEKYL